METFAFACFLGFAICGTLLALSKDDMAHHQQHFMERCTEAAKFRECQAMWIKDAAP